ncbi:hypothetical protein Syun_018929 [Stephania yunnanensis]|uniref:Uncharacterized protein n=1 Tax=Stephania yunnanensis TaxID=152371 RepID=A0AAP0NVG4_9MAGN
MDITETNPFTHEVKVDLDMFCKLLLHWICGKIDSRDIVAIDHCSSRQWLMELNK